MKILTIILICLSFNAFALEDDQIQMDCKRISGKGDVSSPDIIRCENKREICFVIIGNSPNCHIKKEQ